MARHKGAAWLVVARGRQRRCCRGSVRYPAPQQRGGAWHGVQVHDDEAYIHKRQWRGRAVRSGTAHGRGRPQRPREQRSDEATGLAWTRGAERLCVAHVPKQVSRMAACVSRRASGLLGRDMPMGGQETSTRAAWVHGLKQQASVAIPRAGGMQTCDHIGTSFLASSKWQINLQSVLLIMTLHSMHARSGSRVEPAPFARLASRPADNHGSNLAGRQ
jgi:hypothetical protein